MWLGGHDEYPEPIDFSDVALTCVFKPLVAFKRGFSGNTRMSEGALILREQYEEREKMWPGTLFYPSKMVKITWKWEHIDGWKYLKPEVGVCQKRRLSERLRRKREKKALHDERERQILERAYMDLLV